MPDSAETLNAAASFLNLQRLEVKTEEDLEELVQDRYGPLFLQT